MPSYDYDDPAETSHRTLALIWNILTVLVLLAVLSTVIIFLAIFINPNTGLNPFPPPTLPPPLTFPTATPTSFLPATWTPTASLEPTATSTPRPTGTLPPTATPFSIITRLAPPQPTSTATAPRPAGGYAFAVQSPHAIPSSAIKTDVSCNWMGVGGQVLDMSGGPKTQLIVILGGTLAGKIVDPTGVQTSLTGVATQYGRAGFEFVLGNKPVASKNTLWIQIVDQAGTPLSDKVYFQTYADCDKNLILVNFKQVR